MQSCQYNVISGFDSVSVARLDDLQWERIVTSLPHQLAVRAKNRESKYRAFVEGVLWVVAKDAFWGELPARYGNWRALYVRFLRWNNIGVWNNVAEILGKDSPLSRGLMQRADQHAAIVRRRQFRHAQGWMLEN